MSLGGVPAAHANIADEPIINEFVTDTVGVDMLEYVEVLVPENYDTSDLHVSGVEGDDNSNQGTAVHSYPLGDLEVDEDGRLLLTTPVNGLQNAALTITLTNGAVSTGTALDADLDGELEAPDGVEILDVVGINDGRSGAMAWGTELSASQFDGYSGTLGGASRIPDASDNWVPNAYNGAGLDHDRAADAPRGEFEAWNTPGTANELLDENTGEEPDPEPTEPAPEPTDPEDPSEPGEICEADFTLISEIQGEGQGTDMDGDTVTVQGVVTGDFTNNSGSQNGFYIQQQEDEYDGNPATSEGIFIYEAGSTAPEPGTLVAVEGEADEYYEMTQIDADEIVECGEAPLPEPLDVTFPIDDADFAGMESMRVNVEEAVVLETYQFGRYGETVVGPERQFQPTAIHSPESAEALELYEANMANRITIDDRRSDQNPDPAMHLNGEEFTVDNYFRGGDTFRDITGVLDYRFDEWKIQQTQGAEHVPNLERPEVPEGGGDVTVAAFNVLNYFTTFGSRGADNAEEFERQETKIVSAIAEMDADVMGLMEIENNNDVAVNTLVDALNDRVGEDRYSAIQTGMLGTDEITTAIIFQHANVEPVGDFQVLDETVDERFDTSRHRPALAQTFTPVAEADDNGETLEEFTVVTNHLKSKGSECGSEGDNTHLVGSCDAERTAAAAALVDWIEAENMPRPAITGDLNAYDQEAPITTLEDGGYVDLRQHFDGEDAYSYVFDGQLGYLDYVLAGEELMPFITGAASWHANSDEVPVFDYTTRFKQPAQQAIYEPGPYRASDHDPVIFGLSLTASNDAEPTEPEDPEEPTDPAEPEKPTDPADPEGPGKPPWAGTPGPPPHAGKGDSGKPPWAGNPGKPPWAGPPWAINW
jgi:hypothetical protein